MIAGKLLAALSGGAACSLRISALIVTLMSGYKALQQRASKVTFAIQRATQI